MLPTRLRSNRKISSGYRPPADGTDFLSMRYVARNTPANCSSEREFSVKQRVLFRFNSKRSNAFSLYRKLIQGPSTTFLGASESFAISAGLKSCDATSG